MNSLSDSNTYRTNSCLLLADGVVGGSFGARGGVPSLKTRTRLIALFRSITVCLIFFLEQQKAIPL
jgi:hypothetical protein